MKDMREAFEAWYQKTYVHFGQANFHLNSYGEYVDDDIEASWCAWKAALSAVPENHIGDADKMAHKLVFDSESARQFLLENVLPKFSDSTFQKYVLEELAGDFAYQLAMYLQAQQPAQEPVKQESWISVEERLPEIGEEVIVFKPKSTRQKVTALARLIRYEEDHSFYWATAYGANNATRGSSVTHWMPLPLPPVKEVTE